MTETFLSLAKQADAALQAEINRVGAKEASLNEKATLLSNKEASLLERERAISSQERSLLAREEEVSRKMAVVRSDYEVRIDMDTAIKVKQETEELVKKAQSYRDEAQQKLNDLERRELALSEKEKTYRKDIELEVMKHVAFGR